MMTGHSRIEVEVESVEGVVSVVKRDDRAASRIVGFSVGIGLDTPEPGWVGRDTLVGGYVHGGVAQVVELVQVVEGQRGRIAGTGDASGVHGRIRVIQLSGHVAREIGLVDIEPDHRCYTRSPWLECSCSW